MAGCALLSAVGAIVAIGALPHLNTASTVYLSAVDDIDRTDAVSRVADLHSGLVLHAVVSIVGLLVFAPLARAVRRPWGWARVVTWISALIQSVALGFAIPTGLDALVSPNGGEASAVVRQALADLLPGWYSDFTTILVAARLAAILAFSYLLLRSTSGEFYERRHLDAPAGLWTFARRSDPA